MGSEQAGGITLGERIVEARGFARLGQEALAERLGISSRSLTRFENGHREPKRGLLRLIAEVTGVRVEWLEFGQEPMRQADGTRMVPELLTLLAAHLQEGTDNAHSAAPPGATNAPEPGIIALLDDAALAAGLGLTPEDRAALLELRLGGRITTSQEALAFVGPVLALLRRP